MLFHAIAHFTLMLTSIVSTAMSRFGKDQSKAIQKLQALIKQLQEQRDGRDEALLAEVQKLVSSPVH